MRRALLLLSPALAIASATAQTVADSVVVREEVRRAMVMRGDTVAADTAGAPVRRARLVFPTEGGVFYYRAGQGSAIRRPSRAVVRPFPERRRTAPGAPQDDVAAQPVAAPGRASRTEARTSDVTQADLDRLERRLLDALDRRLASDRRVVERPAERPARPAERPVAPRLDGPVPAERPVAQPPDRPIDRPTDEAPRIDEPEVTPEVVERVLIDTGLFRSSRVFFEFGEADLLPVSARVLDAVAEALRRNPALRVEVGGHTDAISSEAFNLALSQRRSASVVAYLVARGVEADRLVPVGYGEVRPVASNETDTGRALNRRVEFRVLASGS